MMPLGMVVCDLSDVQDDGINNNEMPHMFTSLHKKITEITCLVQNTTSYILDIPYLEYKWVEMR